MKPAFSPNLMNAILISELTSSPCSETLHRFGFGSKLGSVGGGFGSVGPVPPLQPAPPSRPPWRPCRSPAARCCRTPECSPCADRGAADQDRHQGERRRVLEDGRAALRPCRERRTRRANMAGLDPFRSIGLGSRLGGGGTSGHGPAGPTPDPDRPHRGTYPDQAGGRSFAPYTRDTRTAPAKPDG